MSHLETHEHAFLDKDNVVINIAVFQENDHNSSLLDDIMKATEGAVKVICCCTFGYGAIGQSWNEETSTWVSLPTAELSTLLNENA